MSNVSFFHTKAVDSYRVLFVHLLLHAVCISNQYVRVHLKTQYLYTGSFRTLNMFCDNDKR